MVSTRALIFTWVFLVTSPFRGCQDFDLLTLTYVFDLLIEKFNLGYIFSMVGSTVLIFHMSVPCNKTFPWMQTNLTFWPWCLTYLLKSLSMVISVIGITFEVNVTMAPCPRTSMCHLQNQCAMPWNVCAINIIFREKKQTIHFTR
jgi:hypothetical protein